VKHLKGFTISTKPNTIYTRDETSAADSLKFRLALTLRALVMQLEQGKVPQ
jgi:hypothetical protein